MNEEQQYLIVYYLDNEEHSTRYPSLELASERAKDIADKYKVRVDVCEILGYWYPQTTWLEVKK